MATLESVQPYVEQLFDDTDVQRQLARLRANLRAAQVRAGKAKSKKKALKDPTLRHRLRESVRAAVAATAAITAAPERQRRRTRRTRLLVFIAVAAGGGVFLALDDKARERVLGLVGLRDQSRPGDMAQTGG